MSTLAIRVTQAVKSAKARHITIPQIAAACGVSVQSVYQWMKEGERGEIEGSKLAELAEITGYSARWIASNKGPKLATAITADEEQLLAWFRGLDSIGKQAIMMHTKALFQTASANPPAPPAAMEMRSTGTVPVVEVDQVPSLNVAQAAVERARAFHPPRKSRPPVTAFDEMLAMDRGLKPLTPLHEVATAWVDGRTVTTSDHANHARAEALAQDLVKGMQKAPSKSDPRPFQSARTTNVIAAKRSKKDGETQ